MQRIVAALALLLILCVSCKDQRAPQATTQPISSSDVADVVEVTFPSRALSRSLTYRAVVPRGTRDTRFRVLYFLHGAYSSPGDVIAYAHLAKLAAAEHLLIVIPNGELSYYTNAKHKSGARWEDAIANDLIEDVELRLPVLPGESNRAIAGVSMGGYGAAKIAIKHPDRFGFVGVVAGALDITTRAASAKRWGQTQRIWTIFGMTSSARRDEDIFALLESRTPPKSSRWFVSAGDTDPLYSINNRLVRELRRRELAVAWAPTRGGHDWNAWNAAMPQLFHYAHEALAPTP